MATTMGQVRTVVVARNVSNTAATLPGDIIMTSHQSAASTSNKTLIPCGRDGPSLLYQISTRVSDQTGARLLPKCSATNFPVSYCGINNLHSADRIIIRMQDMSRIEFLDQNTPAALATNRPAALIKFSMPSTQLSLHKSHVMSKQ